MKFLSTGLVLWHVLLATNLPQVQRKSGAAIGIRVLPLYPYLGPFLLAKQRYVQQAYPKRVTEPSRIVPIWKLGRPVSSNVHRDMWAQMQLSPVVVMVLLGQHRLGSVNLWLATWPFLTVVSVIFALMFPLHIAALLFATRAIPPRMGYKL